MNILSVFGELLAQSGFAALTWQQAVMLLISFILLYLAIKKQFEPLLLLPIAFGMFLANLPLAGLMNEASTRIVRTFLDRSNCPETNFFIGEVVSYPGKWSSFPPHTHVEPEIYFYKFLPENGYGYAEVGDTVYKVHHNDATCMAHGVTHSQATAPGYAEYYIWAIRLRDNDPMVTTVVPEHAWVAEKDAKYFPELSLIHI